MHEIAHGSEGLLREFAEARMIEVADHHLATMLSRHHEVSDEVQLAFALASRELRQGSVYVALNEAHELAPLSEVDDGQVVERVELRWPDPASWVAEVAASPLVGPSRVFVLDEDRLYLARFWATEQQVREALHSRKVLPRVAAVDPGPLPPGQEYDEHQALAVRASLEHLTSVITGGPGTGKTTTVVRILNALGQHTPVSVALAAPTGRAARQLQDSVSRLLAPEAVTSEPFAGTLHKLLGLRPRAARARHRRDNPLPYDVVVLDETSMVSLEHMAALLDAVSPTTRLILVGDPHQLRSVEAGAVLADIVANESLLQPGAIVSLGTNRRSNNEINTLAQAIDAGDAAAALDVVDGAESITFVEYDGTHPERLPQLITSVRTQASELLPHALAGDAARALAALSMHRILCAHRLGPYGVQGWARAARSIIAEAHPGYAAGTPYAGQPLLLTRNSDRFSNGDVGVVVRDGDELRAAIEMGRDEYELVSPTLLDDTSDLHAMTIHKSQGGQYGCVSAVLPPTNSPLATRELLYTAVTRAQERLTIYGTRDAFTTAIDTPVRRASGLGRR